MKQDDQQEKALTAPPPGIRVLLVDDDVTLLKLEQMQLERAGFQVTAVHAGAEALEKAQAEPPEVVLVDVLMPKMDGWEICRRLKANPATRNIPIFFLTALGEEDDIHRHHKSEADGYFIKPFSMDILAKKLKEAVDKRRS